VQYSEILAKEWFQMASHYDEFMLTMIGLVLLIIMSELTDCRKALQAIREQMKEDARERGC